MIYADYNATTPCLPTVAAGVAQVLLQDFGNPSSRHHLYGRRAHILLEQARQHVAALLDAHPEECTFTSGATESCNTALIGVLARQIGSRPRMLVAASEHEAVLQAARRCAEAGAELVELPVDGQGLVDPRTVAAHCDARTALVAVMAANNETGVLQDIPAIATVAHAQGALLFCDCTQAVGKTVLDLRQLGCDLAACSGHKCYAPKGVGLLWQRRGLAIDPLLHGGGQEAGRRGGTENLAGIHGFGIVAAWLQEAGADLRRHLQECTARFEADLVAGLPGLHIHGSAAERIPGTSMIGHPRMRGRWLRRLSRVACSPGSSCASAQREPSHVLLAMGVERELAGNSLRVSFGHQTTMAEVEACAAHLSATGQVLLDGAS
ncbi:MAG: cysteine desulfurase family protein [Planctomycetota bacterium]